MALAMSGDCEGARDEEKLAISNGYKNADRLHERLEELELDEE